MILITHDMGVVAEVADAVAVMYAGQIVEQAPVRELSPRPSIPTPRRCSASLPALDPARRAAASPPSPGAAGPARPADRLPLRAALPLRRRGDCCAHEPPPCWRARPGAFVALAPHPASDRRRREGGAAG